MSLKEKPQAYPYCFRAWRTYVKVNETEMTQLGKKIEFEMSPHDQMMFD